jgi:hypothetical protein
MIPYKPNRPTAVPKTLEARLEIAKAIRKLASDGAMGKFDPEQPRVPAGNADGGQWTGEGGKPVDSTDVKEILARAKQLAASRASMSRCVDLCYRF